MEKPREWYEARLSLEKERLRRLQLDITLLLVWGREMKKAQIESAKNIEIYEQQIKGYGDG